MAAVTKDQLRTEIHAILKDADLETTSSKKVRTELEKKLNSDLKARKKEIDGLVMDYVNSQNNDDESEEESESEDSEEERKPKRDPKAPASKKRKAASSGGSGSDVSENDYKPKKSSSKESKKKKNDSNSDSDSEASWKKKKTTSKTPKKASGAGKRRGTGFTRPYQLSPALAAVVGADSLPRHEVVKKVWAIIKERNLYDPKNKQFAICDEELHTVMGVKRFRTFGMLKYLKSHFIE